MRAAALPLFVLAAGLITAGAAARWFFHSSLADPTPVYGVPSAAAQDHLERQWRDSVLPRLRSRTAVLARVAFVVGGLLLVASVVLYAAG